MGKPYSYLSEKMSILNKRNLTKNLNDRLILSKYNYYNLINAYKEPFLKVRPSSNKEEYKEEYKSHVKLSNLEALFMFDTKMRSLLLTNILKIEESIKHNLVESFYIVNNSPSVNLEVESEYLHKKYYQLETVYSENSFNKKTGEFHCKYSFSPFHNNINRKFLIDRTSIYYDFVTKAYSEINKQKRKNNKNKNNSIKSYIEKHEIVPLWILVNDITLGNISYFYTIQKIEVQVLFLKRIGFYNIKNISLEDLIFNSSNILKILTLCRNICAHNERFYNYEVNIPLSDNYMNFSSCLPFHKDIIANNITRHKSEHRKRVRSGIFMFIFSIYIFLSPKEQSKFINKVKKYILELENKVNEKDFTIIMRMMGMNYDWFNSIKNAKLY